MKCQDKTVIGWREYVNLPEWGIHNIRAKVDTGARTSSLHVENVRELTGGRISFHVILSKNSHKRKKRVTARTLKRAHVKSSIGVRTERWYVETAIQIGPFERRIVLNLISRPGMNFRMLLGRMAIEDAFLVDVDRSFLISKKKRMNK